MNRESSELMGTFIATLAIFSTVGLLAVVFGLGVAFGFDARKKKILSAYWLMDRALMPVDDKIVLVNVTRQTMHVRGHEETPNAVRVHFDGQVIDIERGKTKVGAPINGARDPMSGDQVTWQKEGEIH